ncbi:Uncharacterised protein [Actinobacillus pleuropneumoniae]|nr:Uncharacterised protein [Actinobacillus pleuropneumoniae]
MAGIILGIAFILILAVYTLWFGSKQIYIGIKKNQKMTIIKGVFILGVIAILKRNALQSYKIIYLIYNV